MTQKQPICLQQAWSALRHAVGRGGKACVGLDISSAGWVANGPIDDEAANLLDALAPIAGDSACRVIGQLGQSLDGRIATESGHSHTINGEAALIHLHRLRALVDAVVVGSGTVVADHPRLTVRHVEGWSPVRVVVDPRGRAPLDASPLAADEYAPKTLHLVGEGVSLAPAADHVQRVPVSVGPDGLEPHQLLEILRAHGLRRVLVEGGAITLSRFVDASALDRLHLLVAPMLMGSGRSGLKLRPIRTVDEALQPPVRRSELGQDTLFDIDLRAEDLSGGARESMSGTSAPGEVAANVIKP